MKLRSHLPLALCCAALLAAASSAAAQPAPRSQPGAWRTYQAPSKLFTAEFPGVPGYETRPVDYGIQKETAHRYWLTQPGRDGGFFEIVHLKSPPNDGNLPFGIIIDATIDTVLTQFRSRNLRETARREVALQGCVGREVEATDSQGINLYGRVFIVGEQIFSLLYVGPPNRATRQQDARRFLNSFTAVGTCPPPSAEQPAPAPEVKNLGKLSGPIDDASGWMLIAPGESDFSMLMPGAAEAEEERAQEKPYPLTLRTYSAEGGEASYVAVECGDFPEEMNRVANFEEIKMSLAYRGLEAEAQKLGLRIVQEADVQVSGRTGRQYRLTSDLLNGRALIVSTPRKFYMFAAFAAGPKPQAAAFERFFSSIKLTRP